MMETDTDVPGICDHAANDSSHIVHLFDGRLDSPVEAALLYTEAGVAAGDQVICLLPQFYLDEFRASLPGGHELQRSGQLLLLTPQDVYVEDGRFSSKKAKDTWRQIVNRNGPACGVRVFGTGDKSMLADRLLMLKVIEYESSLNRDFALKMGVCAYDTSRVPEDLLEAAVATHPLIWEKASIRRNPSYMPPDRFFERFYARDSYKFVWSAEAQNCRCARIAVGEIAARMPFDLHEIEDIMLAVGEAFTNAIRHGSPHGPRNRIQVSVTPSDTAIIVNITDEGGGIPSEPSIIDWQEPGGKGLFLMRNLCCRVEHFSTDDGCTVRLVKHATRGEM